MPTADPVKTTREVHQPRPGVNMRRDPPAELPSELRLSHRVRLRRPSNQNLVELGTTRRLVNCGSEASRPVV